MERGKWRTSTPIWVEFPEAKEEGKRKSEIRGGSGYTQKIGEADANRETDPQLRVLKTFRDFSNTELQK